MSDTKDGGPAEHDPSCMCRSCAPAQMAGMSLRDYFAGQVMPKLSGFVSDDFLKEAAVVAYRLADAMLAERERKA